MRRLDDWIKSYMEYTQHLEGPDIFHFWSAVGTICAALRWKCYFDMGYWKWRPNMYIIFVGPPGVATKSTTMGQGAKLLADIPGIHFGPNSLTWQTIPLAMERITELVEMPDNSFHPCSCMTFHASELGTLIDPRDSKMIDILTDLWDGFQDSWQKWTKKSGDDNVANAWIHIVGCTTPAWIASNVPKTMLGGGFTSRCVFVYADKKRQLVPYPKRLIKPEWFNKIREDLIYDLNQIALLRGEFSMTEETYKLGETWYEKNWSGDGFADAQRSGWIARKQGHIHKLAMALSAARSDSMEITLADFSASLKILNSMEPEMGNVFAEIQTTESQGLTKNLIEAVNATSSGRMMKGALYRIFDRRLSWREFQECLESACNAGYLSQEDHGHNRVYIVARKPDQEKESA